MSRKRRPKLKRHGPHFTPRSPHLLTCSSLGAHTQGSPVPTDKTSKGLHCPFWVWSHPTAGPLVIRKRTGLSSFFWAQNRDGVTALSTSLWATLSLSVPQVAQSSQVSTQSTQDGSPCPHPAGRKPTVWPAEKPLLMTRHVMHECTKSSRIQLGNWGHPNR